jgi:tetratricopeptide (TPR) repeat protein
MYAPAHVGAAAAYALGTAFAAFPSDSLYTFAARGVAHADRAIELDSLSADAYAARGYANSSAWGDWLAAERDLNRAVELQPSSADAWGWWGLHLTTIGRRSEAIDAHERALDLDPVSPGRRMGYVYSALGARQTELALEQIRRARAIQPGLGGIAVFYEALPLLLLGRAEECLALDLSAFEAVRAMCMHASGRAEAATELVDSLVAAWTPSRSFLEADGLAFYFARTGQVDRALTWMERALEITPFSYSGLLWPPAVWDPVFALDEQRIRSDVQSLREGARDRVLRERRSVVLP